MVIGLTIVAMGTSAPEAAVSIASAVKGNAGITVGNVVGSNIMNILVILGITAVITTIAVQKSTVRYEMPFMLLTMVVMLLFGMSGNVITFAEGLMMWGLFILYMIYLLMMAKKNKEARVQVILECTEMKARGLPGTSRYVTTKNRKNTPDRLELKKYNPILKRYTIHKEIK